MVLDDEVTEIFDVYFGFRNEAEAQGICLSHERCLELTRIWALKNRKQD